MMLQIIANDGDTVLGTMNMHGQTWRIEGDEWINILPMNVMITGRGTVFGIYMMNRDDTIAVSSPLNENARINVKPGDMVTFEPGKLRLSLSNGQYLAPLDLIGFGEG